MKKLIIRLLIALVVVVILGNYPGLNEATWALAAGFASKVLSLCTGLSEIG